MRIVALCGSLRSGSYNQALLEVAIERAPAHGLEIVQADISGFPLFSQDYEASGFPRQVDAAKALFQSADCVLLVTPEHNYGVPGILKNAVDFLSRPYGDPTLFGRPMALIGASTGHMGTVRAQLAWRQMWHFFRAPVFAGAELTVSAPRGIVDADGHVADESVLERLDAYLDSLKAWLESRCA